MGRLGNLQRFVVLGGAGQMGKLIVRDLVEFGVKARGAKPTEVVVADFNVEAAESLARSFRHSRVTAARADVRDIAGTQRLLRGATAVVNSVQYEHNLRVMEAALIAGCDYIDLGGLYHMTLQQLVLHERFRQMGRLALIGMGVSPGITNVLARMSADELESVHEIQIRSAYRDRTRYASLPALPYTYSLETMLEELTLEAALFTGGRMTFVPPMSGLAPHHFPSPLGIIEGLIYAIHSELATLPKSFRKKGVREVSFKIVFDQDFLRSMRLLIELGLGSSNPMAVRGRRGRVLVKPRDLLLRVAASQAKPRRIGPFREYEIVQGIAMGKDSRGRKVTVDHSFHSQGVPAWDIGVDADTGTPPAIAALMIGAGEITATGVLPPESAVPPGPFVKALARRGMHVKRRRFLGWGR